MNTSENFRSIEMINAAQARAGHTGEDPFDTNIPLAMKGVAYAAFIEDFFEAVFALALISPKKSASLLDSWRFVQLGLIGKEVITNPDFLAAAKAFQKDLKDRDA